MPAFDDVCLCPFYTPVFEVLDVAWVIHMFETGDSTRRLVCCRRPPPLTLAGRRLNGVTVAPRIPEPFIFELIGEISEHDCHLTASGYGDKTEDPIASCWIQPTPGRVSRFEWVQGAHTIHRIVDTIPPPWGVDSLVSEGIPLGMQLFFEPPEGQSLQDTLPVYNRNGLRRPPMSLAKVPFGRAMRILFTINYSENLTTGRDNPRTVYAEIFSLMAL